MNEKWLDGPETFPGLSRNGPLGRAGSFVLKHRHPQRTLVDD